MKSAVEWSIEKDVCFDGNPRVTRGANAGPTRRASRWPRNADKLIRNSVRIICHRVVNAPGESCTIRVNRTNNNAGMHGSLLVQSHEMSAVIRQDCPFHGDGVSQDFRIRHLLPCMTRFGRSQHIMPQPTQFQHGWEREVLIGVEPRHAESRLVIGSSLSLDFGPVAPHIVPGIGQILGRDRRVRTQDITIRNAGLPHAMQSPHRNARSDDARLATTNPIARLNARKGITQILHDMLQHAGLLGTRQLSQKLLHLLQRTHSTIVSLSQVNTKKSDLARAYMADSSLSSRI